MYALVPRILVIKFIEMCPQCSNTHSYAIKRRQSVRSSNIISADKLAGVSSCPVVAWKIVFQVAAVDFNIAVLGFVMSM